MSSVNSTISVEAIEAPKTGQYGQITEAQVALVKTANPDYFNAKGVFLGDDNDMAVLISGIARDMHRAGAPLMACYLVEQMANHGGQEFFTASWEAYQTRFSRRG